ncbi:helix-turn-helix domain-containing protein [Flavihumibacter profundi]|uniref:helix-turn-helix domain-containing protein n=1 Tax=Flavihumibacter profundi TaxID=2716883 RepID=UPI001CC5BA67|nr:XRE family transcriptional regulator [Flavihumibacter profundi]MBZ5857462.1 XRE family transcriptional regulator [Flavihumibacter profundi]
MQDNILIQISNKIKEIRKEKNITIQDLANKAQVSKGLISQIENNRTIPSLPVLMKIIDSLDLDLTDFFKDISSPKKAAQRIELKTQEEYQPFEKEYAKGFLYRRVFTRTLYGRPVDFVLLELKKGARRTRNVKTDSYEYNYMIKGKVEYQIEDQKYIFQEGESLFFDSRLPHKIANTGDTDAIMLVVYFFLPDNE